MIEIKEADIPPECLGITGFVTLEKSTEKDIKLSNELELTLINTKEFMSKLEIEHRKETLNKLEELCNLWIYEKALQNYYPKKTASKIKGKLFAFGSYRLNTDFIGADIDTLLVCPQFISREEFFKELYEYLRNCSLVKDILVLPDAFVPLMTMKLCDVEMDLLFASIDESTVPGNLNLNNNTEQLMRRMDEKNIRSINGVRVTDDLLTLVYNKNAFRTALRTIKLWSKRCGIYSNAMGFLGGVSWAILVARVCQLWPTASSFTIVTKFFYFFGIKWKWPTPILLRKITSSSVLSLPQWNPQTNPKDSYHVFPIITPSYPCQNSTYNVTESHKTIIINHMKNAHELCQQIANGNKKLSDLFESKFFFTYQHYLMVTIKDSDESQFNKNSSLIESKLRIFARYLEKNESIALVHINVQTFNCHEMDKSGKTSQYVNRWFLGFEVLMKSMKSLSVADEISKFESLVKIEIEVIHVKKSNVPQYLSDKDKNKFLLFLPRKPRKRPTAGNELFNTSETKRQKVT